MKLLRANKDRFSFQLGGQEKAALLSVLKLYPLVPAGYQKISRKGARTEDQELLEEALTTQRAQLRRQVMAMMQAKSRFTKNEEGHRLNLKPSQLEWLLQVLNDVRVGCWILLGSPDSPVETFLALNQKTIAHFAAMEIAGEFQEALLGALAAAGDEAPPADAPEALD